MKMNDEEVGQIVAREINDALNHYDSEFASDRIKALDYYLGEPFGNEVEGKAKSYRQKRLTLSSKSCRP